MAKTRWLAPDKAWETTLRGRQILADPRLNHGVAFTEVERQALGITGLLPPQVLTLDEQVERAYEQYLAQGADLGKNVFLSLLQDRNEVLFYRLLDAHLRDMLPIVYTPTIGEAIAHFSHEYRRPRGVFLSIDRPEDMERSLQATGLDADDVDIIVATDGEAILGIGDWGVGGINISLGKLTVYTAAGGIDPGRAVAVMLDVGTNRQELLDDPLYLGNRHLRVGERAYDEFLDSYVRTARRLFPRALLHWEDLGTANARRVLERYRESEFTFNDDMQGTGAVVLAAVLSGLKVAGRDLAAERIVIFGAGTAGTGIADQLCEAMVAAGLDESSATRRFWCVDADGLLLETTRGLRDFQRRYAVPAAETAAWRRDAAGRIGLLEVVNNVEPTTLIGTSGQGGAFSEAVIRAMADHCERPVILPLSNPTTLAEAVPPDLIAWTEGRALIATGSPFPPVTFDRTTYVIAQANNAFVFPGLGLGAVTAGATRITPPMLRAAAVAVGAQVDSSTGGAPLLPEVEALRETSVAVALAVAEAAAAGGVTARPLAADPEAQVRASMWQPSYRPVRAV
jgi:malate dehydrogenase (oxaloacetate-decarboxylating)